MKIDRSKLAKLAEFDILLHEEDLAPRDSFGYDTAEENDAAVAHVEALRAVEVTASYGGFFGSDVLGGCSYASEADFREGGYYEDLRAQAVEELALKLERAWGAIEALS